MDSGFFLQIYVKLSPLGQNAFLSFLSTRGRSGDIVMFDWLPLRFLACDSQLFRSCKSVNRRYIPESPFWPRRWHALILVVSALATLRVSRPKARTAALVSSSRSLAAPATPLMTSDHFRRCTSDSSCRIARALQIWAMWLVIDGSAPAATFSTRSEVCCTAVSRVSTLPRTAVNSFRAVSSFSEIAVWASIIGLMAALMASKIWGSMAPTEVGGFLDRTPSAGQSSPRWPTSCHVAGSAISVTLVV